MVKEGKTVAEEQKAKYEIIYDMGTELYIAKVQLAELKEQDINARIMKNEMQDQLTANIKNRGQLESLPLIALMGEKLEIISGHHRVKSAREAGLKEIIVILDKSGLTRSKAASKQLAHNAISGFDDESTLREIVKLMDNVDDMMESYIGKEILEEPLEQFDKLNTPAVQFDFKTIAFAFLPNQIRDLDALMKNLNGSCAEIIGVAAYEQCEKFVETLDKYQQFTDIRNVGAAVHSMIDAANEKMDDAGFDPDMDWTYLAKVFGSAAIPVESAEELYCQDNGMYYEPNKPNYPLVIVLLLIAGIFWPLVILFAVFVPLTFLLMDKMGQLHPKDDDEMDPEEDTYL